MRRTVAFTLSAAVLALSGCNKTQPPAVEGYPLSLDDAYNRLLKSNFAEFVADRQCGVLIHLHADRYPYDHKIKWSVTSSGREMFNFTVALTAVDASHTKANIEVLRLGDGGEAYDGSRFYARPAVDQPVRPAIEEQVAADLTDRPFNGGPNLPHRDGVCQRQREQLERGHVLDVNGDVKKDTPTRRITIQFGH